MNITVHGSRVDVNDASHELHEPYDLHEALETWPIDMFKNLLPVDSSDYCEIDQVTGNNKRRFWQRSLIRRRL